MRVGRGFEPYGDAEMEALRERAAARARTGDYELFKTSTVFDATARHPEWLGEEPERVRKAAS